MATRDVNVVHRQSDRWVIGLAMGSLTIALLATFGWYFSLPFFTRVTPNCPSIRANSILSLILLSISILLLRKPDGRRIFSKGKFFSFIVLFLCVVRISKGLNNPSDFLDGTFPTNDGPVALGVTICFILASTAVVFLDWKSSLVSQLLATLLGFVSVVALIGHLYHVPGFYSFFIRPHTVGLSIPTSIGLFQISLALFLLRPESGLMKMFTSQTASGELAKRLLVSTFFLNAVMLILIRLGEYVGFYDAESVQVLVSIAILTSILLSVIVISRGVYKEEITQNETKNKIQELQNRLASLVEYSRDAIVSFTLEGVILSWNQQAETLFGYKKEEVIGKLGSFLIPAQQCSEFINYRASLLKGETVPPFRTTRISKINELIDISLSVSPIKSSSNEIIGISWVARDIRDQVEQERLIRALQEKRTKELEQSNVDLDRFAAIVSHDLREPIRTMNIYSQLLLAEKADVLDAIAKKYLTVIHEGTRRVARLIEGLLLYSRATQTGTQVREAKVQNLLDRVLFNLHYRIEENHAVITFDVLPTVFVDELLLERVLQNLVGNAIKYHRPGQVPRVHVGCKKLGSEYQFFVQDDGPGIPKENFNEIFQIFRRSHSAKYCEGMGIGLAICKRSVELLKGRIWVESSVGKGTTFFFTIPSEEAIPDLKLVSNS